MITATAENSFCTIEAAEKYFATRLHSEAWLAASEEERNIALIQASRSINMAFVFFDKDGRRISPKPFGDAVIDDEALQYACCELALDLLQNDPMSRDSMEGLSEITLGNLSLKKDSKAKSFIPVHIHAMLQHLASPAVSGCSLQIIRS